MIKDRTIYLTFTLLCLASYSWLFYQLTGNIVYSNESICIFHNITHLPCPSCGITRSVIYILEGNFSAGLFLNPLGFIAFLGLIIIPIWLLYDFLSKKYSLALFYRNAEKFMQKKPVAITLIILICANWGWNILKCL